MIAIVVMILAALVGYFAINHNLDQHYGANHPNNNHQLHPYNTTSQKIPYQHYVAFRDDEITMRTATPLPEDIIEYQPLGVLPKKKWTPTQDVQLGILGTNHPHVLTNTFVTTWGAFDTTNPAAHWNLDSEVWRKRIATVITGVYIGETPYFGPLYRVNRPLLQSHPNITWANPFKIDRRTSNELFDQTVASASRTTSRGVKEFVYYTGGLNTPQLGADIFPNKEFLPRKLEQSINVWVGEKGVVTHLHIDSYENYFVQVQGKKKFVLFPPENSDAFYLYPFQHPSRGQSQIFPINAPQSEKLRYAQGERFENVSNLTAYEVIVEAGDVLYLPPNWGHQVYTLEPSISVNFWSQSDMQANFQKVLKHLTTHLIHEWSYPQRVLAASHLIQYVLMDPAVRLNMKIYDDKAQDFNPYNITTIFKQRYGATFQYDQHTGQPTDKAGKDLFEKFIVQQMPFSNKKLNKARIFTTTNKNDQDVVSPWDNVDEFHNIFFKRYIDSRYGAGFDDNIYSIFTPNTTEDTKQRAHDTNYRTANINPEQVYNICNITTFTLQNDDLTPSGYVKSYNGAGLMMKTDFFAQQGKAGDTFDYDKDPIPSDVYYEMLYLLARDHLVPEFAQIPPQQRPIYLSDFVETLAYWASPPDAANVPHNIFCFKNMKHDIFTKVDRIWGWRMKKENDFFIIFYLFTSIIIAHIHPNRVPHLVTLTTT